MQATNHSSCTIVYLVHLGLHLEQTVDYSLVAGLRPSTTTLVRKGIIVASPRPHTCRAGNGSADAHRPRTRGAVRGYSAEIRLTVGFSTVVRVTVIREGGD